MYVITNTDDVIHTLQAVVEGKCSPRKLFVVDSNFSA